MHKRWMVQGEIKSVKVRTNRLHTFALIQSHEESIQSAVRLVFRAQIPDDTQPTRFRTLTAITLPILCGKSFSQ